MRHLLKSRETLLNEVRERGFSFSASATVQAWLLAEDPLALSDWDDFADSWNGMPLDQYMADGGRYRRRRYGVLTAKSDTSKISLEPHQPHYQSLDYNRLNGGVARHFEAIPQAIIDSHCMQQILRFCRDTFSQLKPAQNWHIEAHQFRIEANLSQLGKPSPEGVHRDGVDFVCVMMVKRQNISSGTTTMHDLQQNTLDSFTLTDPLDIAIVDDQRLMHGVTPIMPIDHDSPAYRDVLVLTFRAINGAPSV